MKLLTSALGFMVLRTPHQANKLTMQLISGLLCYRLLGQLGFQKERGYLKHFGS